MVGPPRDAEYGATCPPMGQGSWDRVGGNRNVPGSSPAVLFAEWGG